MLARSPRDTPIIGEDHDIVIVPALGMDRSKQHRWPAVGRGIDQPLGGLHRAAHEIGLEHKILGRIADQLKFGKHHQLGALGRGLRAPVEHCRGIGGKVADALVGLAQGDA